MADSNQDGLTLPHEGSDQIVMYSTSWCPDCHRAKHLLESYGIPFVDVDVEEDEVGDAFVRLINKGSRTVPTIIFPDGGVLVEPTNQMLAEKAGFSLEG
mgnify:CR=1 FL=1